MDRPRCRGLLGVSVFGFCVSMGMEFSQRTGETAWEPRVSLCGLDSHLNGPSCFHAVLAVWWSFTCFIRKLVRGESCGTVEELKSSAVGGAGIACKTTARTSCQRRSKRPSAR